MLMLQNLRYDKYAIQLQNSFLRKQYFLIQLNIDLVLFSTDAIGAIKSIT